MNKRYPVASAEDLVSISQPCWIITTLPQKYKTPESLKLQVYRGYASSERVLGGLN
jgi:hypothetical protein